MKTILKGIFNFIMKIIQSALAMVLFKSLYNAVIAIIKYVKTRIETQKKRKQLEELRIAKMNERIEQLEKEQEDRIEQIKKEIEEDKKNDTFRRDTERLIETAKRLTSY